MPLESHALTTVAEARTEVGLAAGDTSQDGRLERLINAASLQVSRAAGGRRFERVVDAVEVLPGYGGAALILPRAPVLSVALVELLDPLSGDPSELDGWTLDAGAGVLHRPGGWPSTATEASGVMGDLVAGSERRGIRVTYSAGWITPHQASASYPGGSLGTRDLPADLEEACLEAVRARYERRDGVASEKLGDASITYAEGSEGGLSQVTARAIRGAYWRPA